MTPFRKAGLRLATVAVATAGTLFVCELGLRRGIGTPAYLSNRYQLEVAGAGAGRTFYRDDPRLGYALIPGLSARERGWRGSRPAFDVCYSTGADGHRAAPGDAPAGAPLVAIFGDSQAFGVGVNDDETAAWRLAEDGVARTVNFGVGGYGPHQLLAMLESGGERAELAGRDVRAGFFVAAADPLRPMGRRSWDHGPAPRYVLGPDGRPFLDGTFAGSRALRVLWRFRRSELVARVDDLAATSRGRRLWVALVVEAARLFESRYGAPLTVVAITGPYAGRVALVEDLRRAGVAVVDFNAEVARSGAAEPAAWLPDGHASPYGQRLLATRLAYEIEALGPKRP